jgi:glutamate dehydrogenase (NADP+)
MPTGDDLVRPVIDRHEARTPGQAEFHHAVSHVARNTVTTETTHFADASAKPLERLTEPDRIIAFRVMRDDDTGEVHVHRGGRVLPSDATGPLQGRAEVSPLGHSVGAHVSRLRTGVQERADGPAPWWAKGSAGFDPKGRSNAEIMRFCQAFMPELAAPSPPWGRSEP